MTLSPDCSAAALTLDPEVKAWLDERNALPKVSIWSVSVEQVRFSAFCASRRTVWWWPSITARPPSTNFPNPWRKLGWRRNGYARTRAIARPARGNRHPGRA